MGGDTCQVSVANNLAVGLDVEAAGAGRQGEGVEGQKGRRARPAGTPVSQ